MKTLSNGYCTEAWPTNCVSGICVQRRGRLYLGQCWGEEGQILQEALVLCGGGAVVDAPHVWGSRDDAHQHVDPHLEQVVKGDVVLLARVQRCHLHSSMK